MDELNLRLQTFEKDQACRWALAVPSTDDMAGAGFYLFGNASNPDTEARDDPFAEHIKESAECEYVNGDMFRSCQQAFHTKLEELPHEPKVPASTPTKGVFNHATPSRKPRAKRTTSTVSRIMTVADIEPQTEVIGVPSPMRINIQGAGLNMELTVNGPETPSKKRRHA